MSFGLNDLQSHSDRNSVCIPPPSRGHPELAKDLACSGYARSQDRAGAREIRRLLSGQGLQDKVPYDDRESLGGSWCKRLFTTVILCAMPAILL